MKGNTFVYLGNLSFKAAMNSDIPLETATIFFFLENLYLKQGIG